jgi:protein SERAC1
LSKSEKNSTTSNDNLLNSLNNFIDIQLNEKHTFCWPKDWLINDLNLKNDKIRIIGVSYHSYFSGWLENIMNDKHLRTNIKERAIELIDQLKLAGIGQNPVLFVTHSMGGIIVKQMLVHLNELKKKKNNSDYSLIENTKGIIFLSTPHLGSDIAKKVTSFSFALSMSNEIAELSSNSKYLLDMNKKFLNLISNNKIKILNICEKLPTYFGFNVYATTVTQESANIGVGEFYLADNKDHLNVCKPDNKKCAVYRKQIHFINDIIQNNNENCKLCHLEKMNTLNQNDKVELENYLFFSCFSNF